MCTHQINMHKEQNALLIGADGTIGRSLAEQISKEYRLATVSRKNTDYSEQSLANAYEDLVQMGGFSLIICCIGILHNQKVEPEKRLAELDEHQLAEYFRVNTILPSLCLKHFHSLLSKQHASKFLFLSAMVGSISDNRLGGWYGYRSSKAALNQMIKTASIEIRRQNKQACVAVVHPGTTEGSLSKPYTRRPSQSKIYSPAQTAKRILNVANSLTPGQSGSFFNWDGSIIPW